ncbi:MAG TPA: host attachment protein [Pirellulales bacterium]|nr:host attachment protein [Pirellulales bacterium]
MDTWILVADSSRARIFASPKKGKPWELIEELGHPESRMKNREINMKEQGRTRQIFGAGHRPRMEPDTEPKEVEAEHFAHELVDKLSDGLNQNAYAALALVAPPHFLGHLRKLLSDQASKCLVATVDKDYTGSDVRELMERLDDVVRGETMRAGAT